LVTLLINVFLFVISLISHGFEEGNEKLSTSIMARGTLKWIFWPWVIIGGMIVPLIVAIYGLLVSPGESVIIILLIAVILQVIGDASLRYGVIKTGYYQGLFPGKPNDFR
jgi:formate-dependent nitrite reductase membrane component NrfD